MKTVKNRALFLNLRPATFSASLKRVSSLLLATGLLLVPTIRTQAAATQTWTGGTSATWGTSQNWNSGIGPAPASTDTALFNNAGGGNTSVTLGGATSVGSITFDTGSAAAYTIGTTSGGTLTLASGGTIQTTSTVANVETINAPITLAGAYTFSSNSATAADTLNFGGPINIGANTLTLGGYNTGANTIGSAISGTGGLAFNGLGTWVLSGNNGYTGGTTVAGGGELEINAAAGGNIVNSKALSMNGGTFDVNGNSTTYALTIASETIGFGGTSTIEADGSGTTLTLTAAPTISGPSSATTGFGALNLVTTGSASIVSTAALSTSNNLFYNGQYVTAGTGTVTALVYGSGTSPTVANNASFAPVTGDNYLLTGSATTSAGSGNGTTFAWVASQGSATSKTLTLYAGKNIVGGIVVDGGLSETVAGTSSATYLSGITSNGGQIIFSPSTLTDTLTVTAAIAGQNTGVVAAVTKTGLGTLILSGTSNYAGGTYIDQGTLETTINNNSATSATSGGGLGFGGWLGTSTTAAQGQAFVSPNSTLDLDTKTNSAITVDEAVNLTNGNLVNNATSGTATLDNGIAGLKLTGTGTTTQTSATVSFTNATGSSATATVTLSSGSVTVLGMTAAGSGYTGATTASFNYSGGSTTTSATASVTLSSLTLNGTANTVGGTGGLVINAAISNGTSTGGFTKVGTGTLVLTGSNTYGGGTTVSGGELLLTNLSGSATGTTTLTVNPGTILAGTGSSSGTKFAIGGTGASTSVLVGMTSASDTNTSKTLSLQASGASTITNANLQFNISAATAGAGTQLSVGNTAIAFSSSTLTLNVQGTGVIGAYTPYVLIAGTGTNQYSGLSITSEVINGTTFNVITGGLSLAIASGDLGNAWYGTNSFLFLNTTGVDDIEVEVVPEPSTWAMMLGGLLALLFIQRRRQRGRSA